MVSRALSVDDIVDVNGQPLRPAAAAFLSTLDRLLIVCSYYAPDHEQFQHAIEHACCGLILAMAGREAMAIEVTAKGLAIEGQFVDPRQRAARKVHELLVPLNIARLAFRRELTPPQLRAALKALQDQRQQLGRAEGFQRIVIDGLPPTVSIATQQLGAAPDRVALDDLLREFEESNPSGAGLDPEAAWRRLAREFLTLAESTLERRDEAESSPAARTAGASGITVTFRELAALRDGLRRLLEVRPDPADLLRLIRHAKMALDLSRDPGTVDLAFRLMCREIGVEAVASPERVKPVAHEDFAFSPESLAAACSELNARQEELAPPVPSAQRDTVVVALCLLIESVDEQVPPGCLDAIDACIAAPEFGTEDLDSIAAIVAEAAARGPAVVDLALPPVLRCLRRHQRRRLADLWERLWYADTGARTALWPHLVNDLLLSLEPAPQSAELHLWMEANLIDADAAPDLADRLDRLDALAGSGTTARLGNLMRVPAARVGLVLSVLMRSRLADRLGPPLHQALRRMPGDSLSCVLAEALCAYDPEHRRFYVDLARELGAAQPSHRFRLQAGDVLAETLAALAPAERREAWTATAIAWLPDLAGPAVGPLLSGIVNRRRFLVLKAWPAACRTAAREALDNQQVATWGRH